MERHTMSVLETTQDAEQNSIKGIILAITGACMWGIMGIFVRGLSAVGYSSFDIAFLRCVLAGVVFFIVKAVTNPKLLKINLKGIVICLFYGVCAYLMGFVCYGISVERIPVAVATVLMFMSPIWVAILGVLVFHEKLTKPTIFTILICIIGAAMVANVFGASSGSIDVIGVVAGILNGFGVALQIMVPRYFAKEYERDKLLVYGFLGAALGLSFVTDFHTIAMSLKSSEMISVFINIIGVGILCTMIANVAVVKATEYINTTTCSILSSLEVVVGAIVGIMIFHEAMNMLQVIGGIIVVVASLGPTVFKKKLKEENRYTEI